jgi:hypothetical protein
MKAFAGMTALTLLLILPAPVFALREESFGNAPFAKQPDWAEGVVDVVNLKSRVYLVGHNGNMNFFYRGNAPALNEALRKYAAVNDDVRQLVLLPGSGKTKSFDGKPVDFDWMFNVPSGIYKTVSKRKHAVMTVYIDGTRPRPLKRKEIEKWLKELDNNSFQRREKAQQELAKLGNDAKPFLKEALAAQPSPEARRHINNLLEKLSASFDVTDLEIPQGISIITVDDLLAVHLKELNNADSYIRGLAIQDLGVLAPYCDDVVPTITEVLTKDKDEWVRRVAALGLANAGEKAKGALPALKEGLKDSNPNIRNTFQIAINQIENAKSTPGQTEKMKRERSILQEINDFKKTRRERLSD